MLGWSLWYKTDVHICRRHHTSSLSSNMFLPCQVNDRESADISKVYGQSCAMEAGHSYSSAVGHPGNVVTDNMGKNPVSPPSYPQYSDFPTFGLSPNISLDQHQVLSNCSQQQRSASEKNKRAKAKVPYKHVPHKDRPKAVVQKRNARERRRVQTVNQAFLQLRKHVPCHNKNKRLSKAKTLHIAIDYINHLQQLIDEYDTQVLNNMAAYSCRAMSSQMGQPQRHSYPPQMNMPETYEFSKMSKENMAWDGNNQKVQVGWDGTYGHPYS